MKPVPASMLILGPANDFPEAWRVCQRATPLREWTLIAKGALVSGPEAYATFTGHATSWYGMIVLFGITACVFIHAASGVRHFVLDIGAGFELDANKLWSLLSPLIGIVLAVAFWAALLLR